MPESFYTYVFVQLIVIIIWFIIYRQIIKLKPKLAFLILLLHAVAYVWLNLKNVSGIWLGSSGKITNGFVYEMLSLIYAGVFTGVLLIIWLVFYQRFGAKG